MMKLSEKNKQRLAAGIILIFFLLAYKCSSQIDRVHRYSKIPSIVTLLPSKPMKFNDGNQDTIYVSITADSIGIGDYDCKIFLFMPKYRDVSEYTLQIGFEDRTDLLLMPSTVIKKYNFAEFDLSPNEYTKLCSTKFDMVSFNRDTILEPCVNIKTKDFFIKFLAGLK